MSNRYSHTGHVVLYSYMSITHVDMLVISWKYIFKILLKRFISNQVVASR